MRTPCVPSLAFCAGLKRGLVHRKVAKATSLQTLWAFYQRHLGLVLCFPPSTALSYAMPPQPSPKPPRLRPRRPTLPPLLVSSRNRAQPCSAPAIRNEQ
ncbi:hypothetical protein DENSPDRAFT_329163 [Dentipellis sp. KUC8613]|nr:hypothetical protein DENSPDRAFT_329163 [Dentipellis sp. KUC8613]